MKSDAELEIQNETLNEPIVETTEVKKRKTKLEKDLGGDNTTVGVHFMDKNGNEKITEVEAPLPESNPDDITPEESIRDLSKKEIDENIKRIDDEHRKYLLDRAKESDIDWDKIEFEDKNKDIPLLSDKDKKLFITVSEDYFGKDMLDMYIDEARATIEQYKEMRELVESGKADTADMDYFETLSKGYQESRVILACIQKSAREIETSFEESKIAQDFIKAITLNSLHDFLLGKFRYNRSLVSNKCELENLKTIDIADDIDKNIKKNMFVTTLYDLYIDRYQCLLESDVTVDHQNYGKNNIFSPEFNSKMLKRYINSINIYIKHLEKKTDIDVSKIINTDLKALDFAKACVAYSLAKTDNKYKEILTDKQFKIMDSKLNLDDINKENAEAMVRSINEFINDGLKNEKIYSKLCESYDYLLRHHKCFNKISPKIGIDEENLCKYTDVISTISSKFPVLEGTNLTSEWADWYTFMRIYETYYSLMSFKRKEEKEDIDYYNIFTILFSDFTSYIYSDFITDIDQFINESVYKKDVKSTMFGMILNNILLQHELGFKADIRTKEVTVPINENNKENELVEKILPPNNCAPGIYDLAKDVFRKEYEYMIGENVETDILLKDVDLVDVRKRYMFVTGKIIVFMFFCLRHLLSIDTFEKPIDVVKTKKTKKRSRKNR